MIPDPSVCKAEGEEVTIADLVPGDIYCMHSAAYGFHLHVVVLTMSEDIPVETYDIFDNRIGIEQSRDYVFRYTHEDDSMAQQGGGFNCVPRLRVGHEDL